MKFNFNRLGWINESHLNSQIELGMKSIQAGSGNLEIICNDFN